VGVCNGSFVGMKPTMNDVDCLNMGLFIRAPIVFLIFVGKQNLLEFKMEKYPRWTRSHVFLTRSRIDLLI
jgi:hypothetical protein